MFVLFYVYLCVVLWYVTFPCIIVLSMFYCLFLSLCQFLSYGLVKLFVKEMH